MASRVFMPMPGNAAAIHGSASLIGTSGGRGRRGLVATRTIITVMNNMIGRMTESRCVNFMKYADGVVFMDEMSEDRGPRSEVRGPRSEVRGLAGENSALEWKRTQTDAIQQYIEFLGVVNCLKT